MPSNLSKRNSFFARGNKRITMRNFYLSLLVAIIAFAASAQSDTTAPAKPWKWSGLYNLSFTQTSLTNWAAGGNNNVNINGLLKQAAKYESEHWTWANLLEANFGYNFQPNLNNKTDDRLEFTTRLDRHLKGGKWSVSLFANFRTQFADGFTNPEDTTRISTFMAPGYLTYGLGLTNKSIDGLTFYISPVTIKQTFVADSTLSANSQFYDLEAPNVQELNGGGSYRTEMGAYIDILYAKAFSENFEVTSRLNLFSNYLDRPENIDVNWEAIFLLKVYSYLSVSLQLQLIYDHDVHVRYAGDTPTADGGFNAPGTQFRQILGVGLAYSFGEFKEK
jgi:hypothetical protein